MLILVACTAPKPAPIVNRTGPGSSPPAVNLPNSAGTQGTPKPPVVASVPTPSTPSPSDVQTAPVRTGSVDTKPLETKPLDPKPAAGATSPSTASAPPSPPLASVMRTQPKGLKRPYSDSLLAELKAADAPPVVMAAVPVATPVTPPVDVKAPAALDSKSSQLAWPSTGKVIQTFGKDKSTGMVFSGKIGDPISAAADGKVIFSNTTLPQYGKMIIVKHDDDTHSVYAHNKTLLVKEGQGVKKGQKIAELGDSGATQPKLYFEVRKQGKPVDPQKLLAVRP
jgi:lipoprotein NlpD